MMSSSKKQRESPHTYCVFLNLWAEDGDSVPPSFPGEVLLEETLSALT